MKIRGSIVLPCMEIVVTNVATLTVDWIDQKVSSEIKMYSIHHQTWFDLHIHFLSLLAPIVSLSSALLKLIYGYYTFLYTFCLIAGNFFFLIFDRERVWYLYVLFFPQLIRRSLSFAFGQYISKQRSTFLETEKKMGEEF